MDAFDMELLFDGNISVEVRTDMWLLILSGKQKKMINCVLRNKEFKWLKNFRKIWHSVSGSEIVWDF